MQVGDLVQYRSYWSTWDGHGIVIEKEKISSNVRRFLVHWPGKPEHVGIETTWESPKDMVIVSENR